MRAKRRDVFPHPLTEDGRVRRSYPTGERRARLAGARIRLGSPDGLWIAGRQLAGFMTPAFR